MNINKISSRFPWIIVGLMLLLSLTLMLHSSLKESAIMDELAHIPAGYGYVKYFDFRLNPEHPPLVKAIAAIPLLFYDLKFPTDKSSWTNDINGQWSAGAQFLYEKGNDADKIINAARIGPILLTLLLAILIYIWASELLGKWWALFPTFLFSFSPNVLAHGHYVTTDIGAAFGIFLASYYFIKHLLKPSKKHLVYAGLAFGIAQLMKFSAVLLIPFFIFLIIIFYLWKTASDWHETAPLAKIKRFLIRALRYLKFLILIFFIGYLLVYVVYFAFTINYPIEKQKNDTEFILTSFANGPDSSWSTCKPNSGVELSRRIRCLANINIWMSENKILRPLGEYMFGVLMVMQRSSGGNTGYFLGEVSASGWWYYFPVIFALKEPLPSLILIALAIIIVFLNFSRNIKNKSVGWLLKLKTYTDYLGTNFSEFAMFSFVAFYWIYSIKSPLNIGVRHIMPTLPFIYILTTGIIKQWVNGLALIGGTDFINKLMNFTKSFIKFSLKFALIGILIIWYLAETLISTPYYLSYFNQIGEGTLNGYKYVTDSNYDWGQDLKRLSEFVLKHNINKIAIDYFGGGSPTYYMGNKAQSWSSSRGNPKDSSIEWMAISINNLQGALGKLQPGQQRNPEDEYRWLNNPYEPYARAGTSIFIYKLQ